MGRSVVPHKERRTDPWKDRAAKIEAAACELEEAVAAYEMSSVHRESWPRRVAEARRQLRAALDA